MKVDTLEITHNTSENETESSLGFIKIVLSDYYL